MWCAWKPHTCQLLELLTITSALQGEGGIHIELSQSKSCTVQITFPDMFPQLSVQKKLSIMESFVHLSTMEQQPHLGYLQTNVADTCGDWILEEMTLKVLVLAP